MVPFQIKSRPWLVLCLVCLGTVVAQTQAQLTVSIGQNFTSTSYDQNPVIPPDANGAIGPRHFMEFINGIVAVYNKTNGLQVQRKSDIDFWSDALLIISPNSVVTDPRVIYDPVSHRWFASQVDADAGATDPTLESNHFLLAVSDTDDPTGSWHGFKFQADPFTGTFGDFPTLGVDAAGVYISGDMFQGGSNPLGPLLVSIPKADLLASTPTIANRTTFGVMSVDERGQVLQPVTCFDGTSTGNVLAMGDIGTDSDPHSNVVSFTVQNAAGPGPATLSASSNILVPPYFVPMNPDVGVPMLNAIQPDGTTTLTANDARISAKVYAVAGVMYAVHNTEFNNRIAIRWYRINASNHALLQSGTIYDPNLDLYFPSIAANTNGTVIIGCSASGPSTFIGSYAIPGQTLNGQTTFGNLMLLQPGLVNYHGDDELIADLFDEPPISRWGDYSATSVDPNDQSRFWTIQMYASGDDIWSTRVTELITTLPPRLNIASAGPNVTLSWPTSSPGYQLQFRTNLLTGASWAAVPQPQVTNGSLISVLAPKVATTEFFRLSKP
jgi:hypothetical protein